MYTSILSSLVSRAYTNGPKKESGLFKKGSRLVNLVNLDLFGLDV